VRCRGQSLRVCVACCASLIAAVSDVVSSVGPFATRVCIGDRHLNPLSFTPISFGERWGGVSLALVLNSGEIVGGVSFPALVLLCAAPVLLPLLKPHWRL
jgi:hypothetical protein